MKSLVKITFLIGYVVLFASCQDKRKPNYQFFPNMYESVGYETYSEVNGVPYGDYVSRMEAQAPVDGTIKRGWQPFEYANDSLGTAMAKVNLKSPIMPTPENLAKGKELYNIYCSVCHGSKGDGQGNLVKREKFLGVPKYNDSSRAITQGSIYHTIYYGKNAMGSHAGQLNEMERWQVTLYVEDLKNKLK
ncbi:MAG: cytochrome c [Flavobacteriaceae bacterium]|nr:cytochrome c [Flavobacteriaceae bacterium]